MRPYGETLRISPGALRTFQILSSGVFLAQDQSKDLFCPKINAVGQVREEITTVMRKYVSFVIEKRLKSAELVESIEDLRG